MVQVQRNIPEEGLGLSRVHEEKKVSIWKIFKYSYCAEEMK
jgi:hypothetical protein